MSHGWQQAGLQMHLLRGCWSSAQCWIQKFSTSLQASCPRLSPGTRGASLYGEQHLIPCFREIWYTSSAWQYHAAHGVHSNSEQRCCIIAALSSSAPGHACRTRMACVRQIAIIGNVRLSGASTPQLSLAKHDRQFSALYIPALSSRHICRL